MVKDKKNKETTNCMLGICCRRQQQANFKRWKRSISMDIGGWQKRHFSIKRMFGEHVTARKF